MSIIFLTFLFALALFYILRVKKRRDIGRRIQGPKYMPLIGYTPIYFLPFEETLPLLCKLQSQFRRFYKIWIGPEFWFVVYDAKLTERILTDQNLIKSNDYKFLKPWLGAGLLTNEGQPWFVKRKTITPALHFSILESFIKIFEHHSEVLLQKLPTNEVINVTPLLLLCAFDIICETSMGIDFDNQQQSESEYIKAVHSVAEISYKRMFNPLLQPDWIFRFLPDHKIFYESLGVIDRITQQVIDERRKSLHVELQSDEPKKQLEDSDNNEKRKKALLDTLLTATVDGKPLSDREIKDEVNTFLFAGHDTTGSTLSFLLYNIAKYPDVQQKIVEEMRHELFANNEPAQLSISKLNNLKYFDLVLKESMRIFTTVPFIGRQTVGEYQLDDILLPNDANISVFLYGMFHNEDLFSEPEKFIPERFESELIAANFSPFSYIPFSAGHRNCIGQRFAQLELKTVTVKILQKFEISLAHPEEDLVLLAGMILKSKNGINLVFTPRSK